MMIRLAFNLIFVLLSYAGASRRLYYTGLKKHFDVKQTIFAGDKVNLSALFPSSIDPPESQAEDQCVSNIYIKSKRWHIYFGQVVFRFDHCSSIVSHEFEIYADQDKQQSNHNINIKAYIMKYIPSSSIIVHYASAVYDLAMSGDYAKHSSYRISEDSITNEANEPSSVEIGRFNEITQKFEEKWFQSVMIGKLISLIVQERTVDDLTIQHRFLLTTDLRGSAIALVMHTWDDTADYIGGNPATGTSYKVVSYNIWHNNPPSWKFGNP
jgi:hypothetical protein